MTAALKTTHRIAELINPAFEELARCHDRYVSLPSYVFEYDMFPPPEPAERKGAPTWKVGSGNTQYGPLNAQSYQRKLL